MTNNHGVDDASVIKLAMTDGREFNGKVIGCDTKTDIAVIKIDAKDLPAITFADSDKIEAGDMVLAVGHPFGIGQSVTTGIISAKGRATPGLDYEDYIQTDAAINPGNSGGALVDVEDRLIGMNTAILSQSGENQGIGFAVPTNLAALSFVLRKLQVGKHPMAVWICRPLIGCIHELSKYHTINHIRSGRHGKHQPQKWLRLSCLGSTCRWRITRGKFQ